MTVYVVMKTVTESFENDLCWEDGYYDDYYETQVTSEELIGIYATEELAQKVAEKEDEKCSGYLDKAYYFSYEVLEKEN